MNGTASPPQPHAHPVPHPGIYVPAITLFSPETDTLVPSLQSQYYRYLSTTGLRGLVILGTNAETLLLTRDERASLLRLARQSLPPGFPIIAGVSGHSTAQVKEFIADAHAAGADYALVLPCAYFGKQTTPAVIDRFFHSIAETSPLPIIIYNFPAVTNGIDLSSTQITALVNAHPNIVGVKLTCGSVAKITRLAATFPPSRFAIFGGQSDFLVGGLAAGSSGCIAAFGNVFPKTIVKVFELWQAGMAREATELQMLVALAEEPTKAGIAATKWAAGRFTGKRAGIEQRELFAPRTPYEEPDKGLRERLERELGPVEEIEATL